MKISGSGASDATVEFLGRSPPTISEECGVVQDDCSIAIPATVFGEEHTQNPGRPRVDRATKPWLALVGLEGVQHGLTDTKRVTHEFFARRIATNRLDGSVPRLHRRGHVLG